MRQAKSIIVTRREVLNILRIREASLPHLERAAKIQDVPDREGYTAEELDRLRAEVRRILGRRAWKR